MCAQLKVYITHTRAYIFDFYVYAWAVIYKPGNTKGGSITVPVDLLFYWFGLVSFANKNKNCQFSFCWFQTSQTGGQQYSDASSFSIPCIRIHVNTHKYGASVYMCVRAHTGMHICMYQTFFKLYLFLYSD